MWRKKRQLFRTLDSLYTDLADAAALRVRTGEGAGLEKIAASARLQEVKMQLRQLENDVASVEQQALMRSLKLHRMPYLPEQRPLEKISVEPIATFAADHPLLLRQQQQMSVAEAGISETQREAAGIFGQGVQSAALRPQSADNGLFVHRRRTYRGKKL
ncbi:MAG: hypothetical protein IPG32_18795 [Saprospirales bacterium]|nr:hypothetical protein [Saprospirales bacterium]